MKNKFIVLVGLLSTLSFSQVFADYTIQIGAMSKPSPAFADKASTIGEVTTHSNASGATVYLVGSFSSRRSAQSVWDELRGAGYVDAFIRSIPEYTDEHSHSHSNMSHVHGDSGEVHDLTHLPEDVRGNVVYLDGRLHIMEGERFIPLHEYGK